MIALITCALVVVVVLLAVALLYWLDPEGTDRAKGRTEGHR